MGNWIQSERHLEFLLQGANIHTSNCEVSIYSFDFMSVAAAGVVVAELATIWVGVIIYMGLRVFFSSWRCWIIKPVKELAF
ncbi:enhancer of polycomb protein [Trifolium repens]|nr:enhancer of polycomb protein [Trifolium repens]